jgi:hypothetical protein
VKKLIVHGIGAVGAAAAAVAMFGMGIAAADDYAGQTYADASSAASDAGQTVIVANRVGDKLPQDECIVTRSWDAPFVRDVDFQGEFGHASDEVMLSLNCNGDHATATNPGASVASPEGREAKVAADQAAAEEQQTLEEVSTPNE